MWCCTDPHYSNYNIKKENSKAKKQTTKTNKCTNKIVQIITYKIYFVFTNLKDYNLSLILQIINNKHTFFLLINKAALRPCAAVRSWCSYRISDEVFTQVSVSFGLSRQIFNKSHNTKNQEGFFVPPAPRN